jgi:hypothetical protein
MTDHNQTTSMNDIDFQQKAHENPWDDSPSFLAAMREKPEREALVATLQTQDRLMRQSLEAPVPDGLRERLLAIPDSHPASGGGAGNVVSLPRRPAWQQWMPIAASLVVALIIGFNFLPSSAPRALADSLMTHVHDEIFLLGLDSEPGLDALNEHLAQYGGHFLDSPDTRAMDATFQLDCPDPLHNGSHFHMVMQGEVGRVTLIVVSGDPVGGEFLYSDERFDAVILPTPEGNLLVAGEKGEAVEDIAERLARNITW